MEIGNNHIHIFKDKKALHREVADSILKQSILGTRANGRFSISLAGGNTPKPIYELLSTEAYANKLPWSKMLFFWGDERFVPHTAADSNFLMLQESLFTKVPIAEQNIFPIPTNESPSTCAKSYEELLHNQFKTRPPEFDMMLLGLGEDGHTASIFPHTQAVQETERWVREVFHPIQKKFRITLAAHVINASLYIAFIVTGKNKASALREVLQGEFNPVQWPAQLIAQSESHVHWFVDEEAASELAKP